MSKPPKVVGCLIADFIRPEGNGKITILGFTGFAPDVALYVPNFSAPVTITYLFQFERASGQVELSFALIHERTEEVVFRSPPQTLHLKPKDLPLMAFQIQAALPASGRYRVCLMDGDREHYATAIHIHQGTPPR